MAPLLESGLLGVWERGCGQHPLDRALTIISAAYPETPPEQLPDLSIGRRDELLVNLYGKLFDENLGCFICCPKCGEQLEFSLSVEEIRASAKEDKIKEPLEFKAEGFLIKFRLPTSRDLAAIANSMDLGKAKKKLVKSCVIHASKKGKPVRADRLPEKAIKKLGERILELDPMSEIVVDLKCPECGHKYLSFLDIVHHFWARLDCHIKYLLTEIHTIAVNYGWAEETILSMNPKRRQFYLEMLRS